MDTLELNIKLTPREPWSGILIAELSELGFDGFMESREGIQAYGPADLDLDEILKNTSLSRNEGFKFEIEKKIIPQTNWNAEWESNFQPVHVEEYATILAPFHDDSSVRGLKVVIQPQMSFGTGHHQTTWLMTKHLFEMDMPAKVLDMGTGTGVLAIVAEKLGAKDILAIDIEEWSAQNAIENAELNGCSKIRVKHGDIDLVEGEHFGLIIANINKNILKQHMPAYASALDSEGVLLLSGFFTSDVPEMEEYTSAYGLKLTDVIEKDEWAAMKLTKTN